MTELVEIARALSEELSRLTFGAPVAYVYNPLRYAARSHVRYLERFSTPPKEVLLLGMNPGPWGMAQTGVPFGEVAAVRDWLRIEGPVGKPEVEHPTRPVTGFACTRSEVSGRRLWAWARATFATPERFFARFFVGNYCPLLFLDEGGRNLTPDRLPVADRRPLEERCDRALEEMVDALEVELVVGVGAFAADRAAAVLDDRGIRVGRILHPSPASPAANRGWEEQATKQLAALGVALPD